MEKFGRLERRWWPRTVKQDGDRIGKNFYVQVVYERSAISAQMLDVSIRSRNGAPSRRG